LSSSSGAISQNNLALHVVKVWDQAGIGVYHSQSRPVAELLLKDDRVPLSDSYRPHITNWRHLLRPAHVYVPPNVRLTGEVVCSLDAGGSKQVWVTVRIPAEATPGTYTGVISVECAQHQSALALVLQVLPFSLLEPEPDLFLWYNGCLDPKRPQHFVSEDTMRLQLQDIYDHGFRSISLLERRTECLQRALDIADEVGFNRNVVLMTPLLGDASRLDFHEMQPLHYVSDEIDVRGGSWIRHHQENTKAVRQSNGKTMASLRQQSFARRLQDDADIGHYPDIVSYYLADNLTYFLAHSEFPPLRTTPTYYYWLSHMEKPNLHRLLAGLYLWKTKAAGIAPYCYQHLPRYPASPLNDSDPWDDGTPADTRPLRHHMTTYPARSGSIPTVQWKGLSEGITDLRYLTTLQAAIASAEYLSDDARSRAAEAQARVATFLTRIKMTAIAINSDTEREPYPDIAPVEYQSFREKMATDIVALLEAGVILSIRA